MPSNLPDFDVPPRTALSDEINDSVENVGQYASNISSTGEMSAIPERIPYYGPRKVGIKVGKVLR